MDHDAGSAEGVGQLDWLLDDLVRRVGHVTKAVILSQDGMALGASQSLGRDDAEHLAALSAGFQSLARGPRGTSATAAGSGRRSSRWSRDSC
jgi:Roadblock/LC7 domain.